jgi:tape measure domain-containing protein
VSGTAARTISIRLSADNAEPTRRALEEVGAAGDRALRRVDSAAAQAQPALQGVAAASDGAARAFGNLGVSLGGAERVFAGVTTGATGAAAAMAALAAGVVAAGVAVARAGDSATESLARLQAATGSIASASAAYEGLYRLSQQTGVAVSESAGAFSRFAIAAREIGATNDQVLALVRTVQQAGIIAGSSAQETSATVMQLGQALASGRLQGDELRSLLENMPTLAEAFARQLGVGVGQLRKMGEEGKLTADVALPALLRAGAEINREFEKLPPTMARSFGILGQSMVRFAADLDRALGLSQAIARAAQLAASAVDRTRQAAGLGDPTVEQVRGSEAAARRRLSGLDARAAEQDAAIADARANLIPSGLTGDRLALAQRVADQDPAIAALRERRAGLERERAAALADIERFNREADELEREGIVQRLAEREAADAAGRQGQRRRDEEALAELRKQLDKERTIREEHNKRVTEIEGMLSRGNVEPDEARRLRAAADKERDEALAKLEDRAERAVAASGRTARATEQVSEAEREYQQLVSRGVSLAQSAASEDEKWTEQQNALNAAREAGRITQEQLNDAVAQYSPASRRAREEAAAAAREAEQFAKQSRDALAQIGGNALDRIGQGLVNAFAQGGKAALDFGSLAKSVLTSIAADMLKMAVINPFANAILGTSRPTLGGALGSVATNAAGSAIGGAVGGDAGGGGMMGGLFQTLGLSALGSQLSSGASSLASSLGLSGIGTGLSSLLATQVIAPTGAAAASALAAETAGAIALESAGAISAGTATGAGAGVLGTGATLGGLLGGVGLGFGAGTLLSSFIAKTPAQSTNGMIGAGGGALAGAAIGSIIPGIGTIIGGLIGGAIGGAGGSLLGPGKQFSGGDAILGIENGRLVVTGYRGKNFGDSEALVEEAKRQAEIVNAEFAKRGLRFGDASPDAMAGFVGGGQSPNPNNVSDALRSTGWALAGLRSDSPAVQRMLEARAGDARPIEMVLSEVDWVRNVYEPLVKTADATDDFAEQIKKVGEQFDATIQRARDLGLETERLNQLREEEINKLKARRELDGLSAVAQRQNVLTAFLGSLQTERMSPEQRFAQLQRNFGDAVTAARSAGIQRADLGAVVQAGGALISAGRDFYATGPQGQALQAMVESQVRALGAALDLPAFGGDLERALTAVTTPLTDELGLLRGEIVRLRDELRVARLQAAA